MRVSTTDRQAKFEIIEQWKKSGLAQKQFYQQQNIPAHVFYYWHKCYRDQQKKHSINAPGSFVQLVSSALAAGIEVQLSNGTRIFFNHSVSVEFLKALID